MSSHAELYLGVLSGTSMDGVDAALVDFSGNGAEVLTTCAVPYPDALRQRLWHVIRTPRAVDLDELGALDTELGRHFSDAVLQVMQLSGRTPGEVGAIGLHGQSVRHHPHGPHPFTLQIGDPNTVAARCGIPTVADFRRRDLAHGGQGAPLAPALHARVFADPGENRAVLNLGGIANVTWLGAAGDIHGFDTGPGNTLIDAWVRAHDRGDYDADGRWAAAGTVDNELLATLRADAYFSQPPPKSTGPEYFNPDWLNGHPRTVDLAPADVAATLTALTACTVADALPDRPARVIVCGGGVHNGSLMQALCERLHPVPIETTLTWGIDPDWVEAVLFAWLARCRIHLEPGSLTAVTGAERAAVLGGLYAP